MTAPERARIARTTAAAVCAGVVAFAGLYSVQAVLPLLSRDEGIPADVAAAVQWAAAFGLAAAVLPWSLLASRFGRRAMLRVAVLGSVVLGLLLPLAPDAGWLIAGRVLYGAVIAGIPTLALATVGETVERAAALRIAGFYIAGTSLGGLAGRIVSGLAGDLGGWRAGVVAASVLCALAAVGFLVLLPAPLVRVAGARPPALSAALRTPTVLAAAAVALVLMGAFSSLYNILGFRLTGPPFGLPDAVVGLVFVLYLLGTASAALVDRAVVRFGRRPVLAVLLAAFVAGSLLLLVPQLVVLLAGLGLATAAFFAVHAVAAGAAADAGGAGGSALYTLGYYLGTGGIGAVGGSVFVDLGWDGFVPVMAAVGALAFVPVVVMSRRARRV